MVARTGTTLVRSEPAPLAPWVPPDPEAIGVSRRMFFNRATIALMTAGITTFAAASFVAFLWPFKTGGFGGKVAIGKLDDVKAGITAGSGFFYAPEARTWVTAYPPDAIPKAEAVYSELILPGMRRRHRRPLPEVPAPRLPRPELRQQPVVRVPVPRLAVQPRRREEGGARTAWNGSLPRHRWQQR